MTGVTENDSPGVGAATAPLAEALLAVELASTDPRRARTLAEAVRANPGGDPGASSVAQRALGLAALAMGDAVDAVRHLRAAVRAGQRADLPERVGEARAALAFVLAFSGQTAAALREADRAEGTVRGAAAARLRDQRAIILTRLGRFDEALNACNAAVTGFRRAGDRAWEARAVSHRGIVHAYRGAWRAAEDDLARAELLEEVGGRGLGAARVRHAQGFVAALRGDIPVALARFDEAEERYRQSGSHSGLLQVDRAEALLSVHLVAEARRAAAGAVDDYRQRGMAADLAEAQLVLANAALLDGDPVAATAAAREARRVFAGQRRPSWVALAGHVAVRAAVAEGRVDEPTLRAARRAADALAAVGWAVPSLDARLIAARVALLLGRGGVARRELALAARARGAGPADLRARAWHAVALARLADGNRRGAETALRAGIRVVDRFRASLGATELRAHVSAHAADLACLGLRLALEAGDPAATLRWAESWRAGALALRPVRPPDHAGLAGDLAELRAVVAAIEVAALEGGSTTEQLRRQARLEEAVRQRARHSTGSWAPPAGPPDLAALHRALGGRALLEYVELDGDLHLVVAVAGRLSLRSLGPKAAVEQELDALRFALRRLATGLAGRSLAPAEASYRLSADRLDALLLGPAGAEVANHELVVVPTGFLGALPWAALPSMADRMVTVAPSAAAWLRGRAARPVPATPGTVVLAAGPGLPGAADEVATLARHYPGAVRLTGPGASAAAVAAALDGAALAHIAAHGRFRADNALFSSLLLADGPLTVYDLEGLGRAPAVVVLSACDSGLAAIRPGDELLGLASALFALGTTALVASVVPVPDSAGRPFMAGFHRHLRGGLGPAAALAEARRDAAGSGDTDMAVAAAGFVCFGAG